jgi:hypothetical protein
MLLSLTLLWQDCVCLIAPYPNNPKTADQFDFQTDGDIIRVCDQGQQCLLGDEGEV